MRIPVNLNNLFEKVENILKTSVFRDGILSIYHLYCIQSVYTVYNYCISDICPAVATLPLLWQERGEGGGDLANDWTRVSRCGRGKL